MVYISAVNSYKERKYE